MDNPSRVHSHETSGVEVMIACKENIMWTQLVWWFQGVCQHFPRSAKTEKGPIAREGRVNAKREAYIELPMMLQHALVS